MASLVGWFITLVCRMPLVKNIEMIPSLSSVAGCRLCQLCEIPVPVQGSKNETWTPQDLVLPPCHLYASCVPLPVSGLRCRPVAQPHAALVFHRRIPVTNLWQCACDMIFRGQQWWGDVKMLALGAPHACSLHCLSLADGKMSWKNTK